MKATCDKFVDILRIINTEGIINFEMLRENPDLYRDFWFAMQEFCHFALCSKTSTNKSNRASCIGNAYKISELERHAYVMRDEVETDCAIKIIEKLDLVLRQPLERQLYYCYMICNNVVNDYCREFFPKNFTILSLTDSADTNCISSDSPRTYEDVIPDNRYNPECICLEAEAHAELKEYLKAQKNEAKKTILLEIDCLSKRPAEVLVRLAEHLNIKPRYLASDIICKGCKVVFAETIVKTAKAYSIEIDDIRRVLRDQVPTEKSVKADSNDADIVASQISRLKYRADKHLKE